MYIDHYGYYIPKLDHVDVKFREGNTLGSETLCYSKENKQWLILYWRVYDYPTRSIDTSELALMSENDAIAWYKEYRNKDLKEEYSKYF